MVRPTLIILVLVFGGFLVMVQPAQAAGSLFLAPNVGTYGVGSTITTRVVVGTGGQAINSSQATISYDTSLLEPISVSRSGSIFSLWPSDPQASGGLVTYSGGLPNPGYSGNGGLIITITFRARAVGTATVKVVSGKILLNDGHGTNILTGYGLATYTINQSTPTTGTPTETGSTPGAPTINSATHPDPATWYAKNNISLSWDKGDGVLDFSYLYDDQAGSIPDTVTDTDQTSLIIQDSSDGTAYFHVRARNDTGWGETAHFKISIDTTPPEPFVIRLEGENPTGLRQPYIDFEATDAASGILEYELFIDDVDRDTIKPGETTPYQLPKLDIGAHVIKIMAVDRAGNTESMLLNIDIVDRTTSPLLSVFGLPTAYRFFLLAMIIIFGLLLILVLILALGYWRRLSQERLATIVRLQRHDRKHHQ